MTVMHAGETTVRDVSSPYESDPGLREIIVQFVSNLDDEAPKLTGALARRDFAEFVRLTHRLRGSAKVLGFDTLGNVFGSLEELGREAISGIAGGGARDSHDPRNRDALLCAGLQRCEALFLALKIRFSKES